MQSHWLHFKIAFFSQDYTTCIRQEQGFCTNSYVQNADTTPDTFDVYNAITAGTTGAEVGNIR